VLVFFKFNQYNEIGYIRKKSIFCVIKSDKLIFVFYIVLGVSFLIFILDSSPDLSGEILSVLPQKVTDFETSSIIDVDRKTIFNLMSNIEIYPNILPRNINHVNILSQIGNEIIAEEEFQEVGIKTKLIVKHTIKPYDEHIIEILDGDAKGTTIKQFFEDYEHKTKLITKVHLNFDGVISVFSYIPESNMIHAVNTVTSKFVEYTQKNVFEKTVDSLYLEILKRPADVDGLLHFSSLLENGEMSEDEIRFELLNSTERESMNNETIDFKPVSELTDQTKDVINDLYQKILLREADPDGMYHFGNMLENDVSSDEIRNILLLSDEGKDTSIFHPIRIEIKVDIQELFDRTATYDEISYYHKLIDDGTITLSDVTNELKQTDEYINRTK
jgi:ribosome-associated toxin RatA of RatAB toxin-antitoxin module